MAADLVCRTECSETWSGFANGAPCILGIDEAGRGPVLGPMVHGCAIFPLDKADELKALGVDDSKALTEAKRDEIFDRMNKEDDVKHIVAYAVRCLSAQYISASMLKRCKYSLNEISHEAAITLIKDALSAKVNVVEIKVDTVGPKATYQAKLEKIYPGIAITYLNRYVNLFFFVEEKADSKFPIVSAVSIAAKVNSDERVRGWCFPEPSVKVPENGFGSGYPADLNTKKFLVGAVDPVFGYPSLVRFSWKTADIIIEKRCVKGTRDEEESGSGGGLKGWAAPKGTVPPKRHSYFADRTMSNMTSF